MPKNAALINVEDVGSLSSGALRIRLAEPEACRAIDELFVLICETSLRSGGETLNISLSVSWAREVH